MGSMSDYEQCSNRPQLDMMCVERMTLLILYYILYITKRLVWADNMFCVPEQLADNDVVARERPRITW